MFDRKKHEAEVEQRRVKRERERKWEERRGFLSGAAIYLGTLLFVAGVVAGIQWGWKAHQCEAACDLREQPHEYLFGQGCYCQDEAGWYNPNDER
jgi:hypothetical protein